MHPMHVNNPPDIEKGILIFLNLDFLCSTFVFLDDLGLFQYMD